MARDKAKHKFEVDSSSERKDSEIPLVRPKKAPWNKEASRDAIAGGSDGSTRLESSSHTGSSGRYHAYPRYFEEANP